MIVAVMAWVKSSPSIFVHLVRQHHAVAAALIRLRLFDNEDDDECVPRRRGVARDTRRLRVTRPDAFSAYFRRPFAGWRGALYLHRNAAFCLRHRDRELLPSAPNSTNICYRSTLNVVPRCRIDVDQTDGPPVDFSEAFRIRRRATCRSDGGNGATRTTGSQTFSRALTLHISASVVYSRLEFGTCSRAAAFFADYYLQYITLMETTVSSDSEVWLMISKWLFPHPVRKPARKSLHISKIRQRKQLQRNRTKSREIIFLLCSARSQAPPLRDIELVCSITAHSQQMKFSCVFTILIFSERTAAYFST